MKIALAVDERSPDGKVPALLKDAKYLFITELEGMLIEKIYTADDADVELLFAKMAAENMCETIICGEIIRGEAFSVLVDDQISRLNASGMTANEAVKAMLDYTLPYIMDVVGGKGCEGGEIAEKMGIDVLGRNILKEQVEEQ